MVDLPASLKGTSNPVSISLDANSVMDRLGSGVTADQAIEAKKQEAGLDPGLIEKLKERQRAKDIEKVAQNPGTGKFLKKEGRLEIVQDDVLRLNAIEQIANTFQRGRATVQAGEAGFRASLSGEVPPEVEGLEKRISELSEGVEDEGFISYLNAASEFVGQQYETLLDPVVIGTTGAGAAAGSAFPVVGTALGAGAGFFAGNAAQSVRQEMGHSYLSLRELGATHETSQMTAAGVGIVNGALEMVNFKGLTKPLTDGGKAILNKKVNDVVREKLKENAFGKFAKNWSKAIGTEVATEAAQEAVNIASEEWVKALEDLDVEAATSEEIGERIGEVVEKTFKTMVIVGAAGPGFQMVAEHRQKKRALQDQQTLDTIQQQMAEGSTFKKDPDTAAEHVGDVLKANQVNEMTLEPEGFLEWLDGIEDKQAVIDRLGIHDQLENARELGVDIVVPSDRYARVIMSRDDYASVSEHARTEMDGLSPKQAKEVEDLDIDAIVAEAIEKDDLKAATPEDVEKLFKPTTEQDQQREYLGLKGLFKSADEAGMSPKQYEAYLSALKPKKEKQDADGQRLRREKEKEQRLKSEAEEKVRLAQEPVYRSQLNLTDRKLDLRKLQWLLGEDVDVPKKHASLNGEVDPDAYANLYGYENARAMVIDWNNSPTLDRAAKQAARKKLGLKDPPRKKKVEEARKEVHTDAIGNALTMELNALRKQAGEKQVSSKVVKDSAAAILSSTPINQSTPAKFYTAARRAGRQAAIAVRKGDLKQAARYKFQQVSTFRLAQEAYKLQTRLENQRKYLAKFQKDGKHTKDLPQTHLEAIREILDSYNFKRTLGRRKSNKLSRLVNDPVDKLDFGPDIVDTDTRKFWKNLPVAKFSQIHDAVKTLEKRGKDQQKLRLASEQRKVDHIAFGIAENIRNNLKHNPQSETAWAKLKENVKSGLASFVNMDTLMRQIDGFKDQGIVHQNLKARYDRAISTGYRPEQVGYENRQDQVAKELVKMFDIYTKSERLNMTRKVSIPGVERQLTHEQILSVILNSGNPGNVQSLVKSKTFTESEVAAIQDFASEKDWKFAQGMWDYFDSFWVEIKEAQERRNNIVPQKVEAQEVKTRYGTFKGGYYPIMYDRDDRSAKAESIEVDALIDKLKMGEFVNVHTANGYAKNRQSPGAYRVRTDLGVIKQHLNALTYDLEVVDALYDIGKLFNNRQVKQAFNETGNKYIQEQIDLWFRDIIEQEVISNNAIEKSFRWLRSGFTISKMGWNVGVAAVQPLGILQSAAVVGKTNMTKSVGKFLIMPNKMGKEASAMSGFMRSRETTFNKDIREARRLMTETWFDKVTPGNSAELIRNSMFYPIAKMQRMVDIITFDAAIRDGAKKFSDPQTIIEHAERVVARSQASGIFGDRAAIERGTVNRRVRQTELVKAFTPLMSYFLTKNNIAYERARTTNWKNIGSVMNLAFDLMMIYTLEAVLAAFILNRIPEDEEILDFAGVETAKAVAAGIPFIREFSSEASGFRGGGITAGFVNELNQAVTQVKQGEFDQALVTNLNDVGGQLFHYPSGQINKFIRTANQEEVEDWREYFLGPKWKD